MSDRFAWGAGDLTPEEVVESARLDEGRHSAGWREDLHPRDADGQFGSGGGGGGSPSGDSPAGSSPSAGGGRRSSSTRDAAEVPRGMPSVLASARIPGRNGTSFAMEHHADGGLTISDGHHSTKLDKYKASELMSMIKEGDSDYMDIGTEWWVKGDSIFGADGERLPPRPLAMLTRTGKDSYELKVGDDNQTYADIRASAGVTATESGLGKIQDAYKRFSGATRVDTGNGDVDVFFADDKKIAFRMLGDDGTPHEVKFKPRDFDKIADAMSVVNEGFDEMERFVKHPKDWDEDTDFPAVSSVTFPTNAGKVRVELKGEWRGNNPGDQLWISAADDSWAVIVDGPQQAAWEDAMDALEEADEEGDVYYRGIGWSGSEGPRRPRKPRDGQVTLTESAGGVALGKGRRFRARLIAGDVQGSSGYYSAGMLRKNAGVFREGLPVYLDHPGVTEAYERPERSVRDLAGRLATAAVYEGDGLYADVEVYPHWAPVIEAMADDIGMSIRASGTVEASTVESIRGPIVTSLTEASSVDFVTAAGAGGKLVQLLESARAGNLAPPFKKKGADDEDEKPDVAKTKGAETDDEEDDDEDPKKKDKGKKMPAFLKKILAKESDFAEAGTVGAGFESHIHSGFTALADGMYGEGRLNRPERLTLSTAIGEALAAFMARVEADQPHLYQRGLFDDPPAVDSAAMTEHTTMEGAPMTGSTNDKQAPPERGTDVTESARVNELTTALAEARNVARSLTEAQVTSNAEIAELRDRLDAGDAAKQELANDKDARKAVAEALKTSGLLAASHARVTESVVRDLPVDDDGVLDTARLAEAIKAAINDKKIELAEALESAGVGSVRGLGESVSPSEPLTESAFETGLVAQFERLGMTPAAAQIAAAGRK